MTSNSVTNEFVWIEPIYLRHANRPAQKPRRLLIAYYLDVNATSGTIGCSVWRSARRDSMPDRGQPVQQRPPHDSPATARETSETREKIGARSNALPSVTMPSNPTAPLAQLAEQLTLNQ
jgi:hypothetical protein